MNSRISELMDRLELYVEIVKVCLEEDDRNTQAQLVELGGCVRRLYNAFLEEKARRNLRDDVH